MFHELHHLHIRFSSLNSLVVVAVFLCTCRHRTTDTFKRLLLCVAPPEKSKSGRSCDQQSLLKPVRIADVIQSKHDDVEWSTGKVIQATQEARHHHSQFSCCRLLLLLHRSSSTPCDRVVSSLLVLYADWQHNWDSAFFLFDFLFTKLPANLLRFANSCADDEEGNKIVTN